MKLLSTKFDKFFLKEIPHFKSYPSLLPFVGYNWTNSKRILLIGESHYLPFDEIWEYESFDFLNNWYEGSGDRLSEHHINYLNTRSNIFKLENGDFSKPLTMYFNLKKSLLEVIDLNENGFIFDRFSYYKYFQKPAAINEIPNENRSIIPLNQDISVAFETFNLIVDILEPKVVIFVSSKSYNSFLAMKDKNLNFMELNAIIDVVPHAGSRWWNRSSGKYGNKTGKQKFIDLISGVYE
jgi:hypothetical protein